MTYTDYDFYRTHYAGNAIPIDVFAEFSMRASERIACDTRARATQILQSEANAELKEAISRCTCAIADILYAQHSRAKATQNGLASESLGNWSRTYRADDKFAVNLLIHTAEKLYLSESGLLYRGRCRHV